MDNIGQRLREERQLRGWSQRDLARETGVNTDTISGIETGQHEPRPSTLRKLAEGLGIEVRDLFAEPALPKGEAPRGAEQLEEERPIFDVVRGALLRQAEQDRQAFARTAESGRAQAYFMRHENEAMRRLLEYSPGGELAEAYIELMWRFLQSEQERERLASRVEILEHQLAGVEAE